MKGLLLKDILVIIKQLKIFLIVIPVISLVGGGSMGAIAILIGASLPMTAIAYDERSKWNEIAIMMPYSKKDIIVSKYLLGYFCLLIAAALSALVQLFMSIIEQGNLADSISALLFSVFCGLIFIAINTPILFRYGSEKGRFVFIAAMALVAAFGAIVKKLGEDISLNISVIQPIALLGIAVLVNFISIFISMRNSHRFIS